MNDAMTDVRKELEQIYDGYTTNGLFEDSEEAGVTFEILFKLDFPFEPELNTGLANPLIDCLIEDDRLMQVSPNTWVRTLQRSINIPPYELPCGLERLIKAQEWSVPEPTQEEKLQISEMFDTRRRALEQKVSEYKEAILDNPDNVDAHLQMGLALLFLGRMHEGQNVLEYVNELAPGNPSVQRTTKSVNEANGFFCNE